MSGYEKKQDTTTVVSPPLFFCFYIHSRDSEPRGLPHHLCFSSSVQGNLCEKPPDGFSGIQVMSGYEKKAGHHNGGVSPPSFFCFYIHSRDSEPRGLPRHLCFSSSVQGNLCEKPPDGFSGVQVMSNYEKKQDTTTVVSCFFWWARRDSNP